MARRWKIFYDNWTTFSDKDGTPDQAPATGVVLIAQEDPEVGRVLNCGRDFYVWIDRDGSWWNVDHFGFFDYLCQPGWKRVLFGRTVTQDEWRRMYKWAQEDSYLPLKGGFLPSERKP